MRKAWVLMLPAAALLGFLWLIQVHHDKPVNEKEDPGAVIMASGAYFVPPQSSTVRLAENIVQILRGDLPGDKTAAKQEVVNATLEALGLQHWQDFSTVGSHLIFADIHPAAGQELVAGFAAGKDNGAVAFYTKQAAGYELTGAVTDLVPVMHLGVIGLPGMEQKALVLEEYLDEMTGAFMRVRTKSVYFYKDDELTKIWEREKYREEYYPEGGRLQGERTRWLRKKELAEIFFTAHGEIIIKGTITSDQARRPGEMAGEYKTTGTERYSAVYIWDARQLTFVRKH